MRKKLKKIRSVVLFIAAAIFIVLGCLPAVPYVAFTPVSYIGDNYNLHASGVLNGQETVGITNQRHSVIFEMPDAVEDDDYITLEPDSGDYVVTTGYEALTTILPYESNFSSQEIGRASEELGRTALFSVSDDADISEVMDHYTDLGYCVILYSKDDISAGWTQDFSDLLENYGFSAVSADDLSNGLAAVWYNGRLLQVNNTTDRTISARIPNHWIRMKQVHAQVGHRNIVASVTVDGVECSGHFKGLNIVVLDVRHNRIVDSMGFAMDGGKQKAEHDESLYATKNRYTYSASILRQARSAGMAFVILQRIALFSLAAAFIFLGLDCLFLDRRLTLARKEKTAFLILESIPLLVLMLMAPLIVIGYQFLLDQFPDMSIDQLIYHLNTNLNGTNAGNFSGFIRNLILAAVVAAVCWVIVLVVFVKLNGRKNISEKKAAHRQIGTLISRWAIGVGCICVIMSQISAFWQDYNISYYISSKNISSSIFEDRYVDPKDTTITFPEEKKNLIYIFMESMEISSASTDIGGALEQNTIPDMTELALKNDDFNGETGMLNGAAALQDCTWTIAGMVAQTAGIPLKMDSNTVNNARVSDMLPGATAIGDILEENGYHNEIIMGSDAEFGNRDLYYQTHGNYDILDLKEAKNRGLLPSDYHVFWGFEDTKLYEFAQQEATALAEGDQPFNLTLLTVDTHYPEGYTDDDTPTTFDSTYANVVYGADLKVTAFVKWVQQQSWGKDTVIVINGDHCFMGSGYFDYIDSGYERKTYTCIINSSKEEPDEVRTYSTMDMFPTTLSALGATIEGDRLGLGTDLYSSTPTMMEELSEDYINQQIGMDSDFYNNVILQHPVTSSESNAETVDLNTADNRTN